MKLTSSAFSYQQNIPGEHTGEGIDLSPPLAWSEVPEKTKGFALICEDPDAPPSSARNHPYVHWLIYNIPGETRSLPAGLARRGFLDLPVTAAQGINSFGNTGWNGPMPPQGHGLHHYEFKLFALDRRLYLPTGLSRTELMNRLEGRILESAKLVGTYERRELEKEAG